MDAVKYILVGLVGMVSGGLIGWFAAREHYKIDYDIAAEAYDDLVRKELDLDEELSQQDHSEELSQQDRSEDEYSKVVREYFPKPDLKDLAAKYNDPDLDKFLAEREAPEEEEGEELDDEDLDEPIEISREAPYVITAKEFDETKIEYDKVYMSYYRDDEILIEDDFIDDIVDDVEQILGPDALSMFGWDEEETNVVCVRNENRNTDYYISLVPGSYAELVQGIKDPIERRRTHDSL